MKKVHTCTFNLNRESSLCTDGISVGFILFLARIANVDKSGPQVLIYFYVDSFLPVF